MSSSEIGFVSLVTDFYHLVSVVVLYSLGEYWRVMKVWDPVKLINDDLSWICQIKSEFVYAVEEFKI